MKAGTSGVGRGNRPTPVARGLLGVAALFCAVTAPGRAGADEMSWTAYGGGNWNLAANWSP